MGRSHEGEVAARRAHTALALLLAATIGAAAAGPAPPPAADRPQRDGAPPERRSPDPARSEAGRESPRADEAPAPAAGAAATVRSTFRFVDVAAEAGLTRVTWGGRPGKDHLLDSAGTGAAFLDYDGDGRLDVYLVNAWRLEGSTVVERGRNALYRGRPDGTFEDVTERAGVDGGGNWGSGVAVADVDDDGHVDIFVTNFGPSLLYRNRGDGRFEEIAAKAGLAAPGWNTGAAFLDADRDGDLDLYVAAYIRTTLEEVLRARPTLDWKGLEMVAPGPFGFTGAKDHYYLSDRGRSFTEATDAAGLADRALGFGFAVRAADLDDDGDLDIYVANDSDANYQFRNDGRGRFEEVGVLAGSALDTGGAAQAGMGIAAGDLTGDGVLDLVVTNFSEDTSTLYRGLGRGFFEDVSAASGLAKATFTPLSWGVAAEDFDNDGDLDLAIACGHIYPQIDRHPDLLGTFLQRNLLLENTGGGVFVDASDRAGPGFAIRRSHRAVAAGDYDDDGDVDLLVTAQDAPPELLRNESAGGAWLTVVPVAPAGKGPLIGTSVSVTAGGRTQRRDIASGDSYVSSHDPRPHFGLGAAERADVVEVRWSDGTLTVLRDVPARQFLRVVKGS